MRHILLSCFILTTLFYFSPVSAVVVENLYQVSVPVSSHAAPQRQQAIIEAFKQVLVKVSGNVAIEKLDKNDAIKTALTHVDSYVQQYSYAANPPTGEVLRVKFDAKGVNKLIQQAGQKAWNENRPLVVMWIVQTTKNNAQPTLISKDTDIALTNAMHLNAERRGLAVLMPLLDLQDIQHVTPADVSQPNIVAIKEASKRYNAEAILIGQLTQGVDNKWDGNWTLLQDSGQKNWKSVNNSVEAVAQAMDETSDALAANDAGTGEGKLVSKDHVEITILKVNGISDYAKIEAYLGRLSMVKNVQVVKVEPTSLVFDLTLTGDIQAFVQAINTDKKLQPTAAAEEEMANNRLTYQWQS